MQGTINRINLELNGYIFRYDKIIAGIIGNIKRYIFLFLKSFIKEIEPEIIKNEIGINIF